MPALTRQRTPQSLHSEWSHSSLGATISIHALAKPLMKVMYHRAVLDLIKRQHRIPLSAETMEIYESYLGWKYVAATTKTLIMREICQRARVEPQARVIGDFLVPYDRLLESTNIAVRRSTCLTLAELALHSSTRGAVVAVQPCARLVGLLGDGNVGVVQSACYALSQISFDLEGARAVVEAGALNFIPALFEPIDVAVGVLHLIPELLDPTNVAVRRWTCGMLGRLASHSLTRRAVVAAQPCARLVVLLGDGNVTTVDGACYALSQISRDLDGARAVLEAGALGLLKKLLHSYNRRVRKHACLTFTRLAGHSATRGAVVAVRPCARLVALLREGDVDDVKGACYVLAQISLDLDGARAVVAVGVLEFLKRLLEAQDSEVRKHSCWILAELAFHSSTRGAAVAIQPWARLVPLLGDGDVDIVEGACYALSNFSRSQAGAKALMEAGTMDFVPKLIESSRADVRRYTCVLLGLLARYNRLPPPM
ncbi:armadillo-type protein [Mycena metata]|uniref:Armadillo-type protein n=1 Tax=Mycena metata TaxID=1033252 RepID=A0AAD7K287_9AGAR|nr:armadillo-type protein [Mycena metata]